MLLIVTTDMPKKKDKAMQQQLLAEYDNYKYHLMAAIPLGEMLLSENFLEKGLAVLEVIYMGEFICSVCFDSIDERILWIHDILICD